MLRIAWLTFVAFTALWDAAHAQQAACTNTSGEMRSTEFGVRKPANVTISSAGLENGYNANDAGLGLALKARYYRLRIVPLTDISSASDWSLAIRDENQRVQQFLRPNDFEGAGTEGVWTRFLKANRIIFDLHAQPGTSVSLKLAEAVVLPEGAADIRYSWKGLTPDYRSLYAYDHEDKDLVRRSGDRIGFMVGWDRIEFAGTTRVANWCCTGVMLTKDLMLTNWHCGGLTSAREKEVWRDSDIDGRTCDRIFINMAWDDGSAARDANCQKLEFFSKRLDYAIVRVKGAAGSINALTTTRPLRIARERPVHGARIRIVHHAECKPKLVSYNCAVSQAERGAWDGSGGKTEFAHNCDTEGGSSGAPVFSLKGELIGLHHLGYQPVLGDPTRLCDRMNKAIHIDEILSDIEARNSALYKEIVAGVIRVQ